MRVVSRRPRRSRDRFGGEAGPMNRAATRKIPRAHPVSTDSHQYSPAGPIWVSGGTEDEVAAAIAAVIACLAPESAVRKDLLASNWARTGRLEAQGIIPTPRALRRGWSIE